MFAILVLGHNRSIGKEQLIDRLWGDQAPSRAKNVIATYVTRLRQAFRAAGQGRGIDVPELVHEQDGYALFASDDAIDFVRLRRACAGSGKLDDFTETLRVIDHADGVPLANVDSTWLRQMRPILQNDRRRVILRVAREAEGSGQNSEVVRHLLEYLTEEPMDEEIAAWAILSMHRSGRTSDALDLFSQTRRRLIEDLGIEPGPFLTEAHHCVLG